MTSSLPSARATIIVLLQQDRSALEATVVNLITVTPPELFDVILLDVGASPEVLAFTKALEGDVEQTTFTDVPIERALEQVITDIKNPVAVVLTGSTLDVGWLDAAITEPKTERLASGAITVVPGEARKVRSLWFGATREQPQVLSDLGPHFQNDLNVLLNHVQTGRAWVGALPYDVSERMRERMELEEERRRLELARNGRDVCWTDENEDEPLITIGIPTYNRGQTIVDTAINSILAQTYERFELIVVGDRCDEATEKAILSVKDPRVKFLNLPVRGTYPKDKWLQWLVAGIAPVNMSIQLAQGSWIAPCDDDDEFTPDHIEVLLREARERRLEMVWSKSEMEVDTPGNWQVAGGFPIQPGNVIHGTVLYSSGLRFMHMSGSSWKINEPTDGNFWRRMTEIGVRTGFVDHVTYRHFLEGRYREQMTGPTAGE